MNQEIIKTISEELNVRVHQIDLSNLENGSYFATVYSQSFKKTVQFVLSR